MEKVICASRIREALQIRNMKQIELAEKTGLSRSLISYYCSGRFIPKQDATNKLAKALDVNEAWLMDYDVPMEKNSSCEFSNDINELIQEYLKLSEADRLNILSIFKSLNNVKKQESQDPCFLLLKY